MDIWLLVVIEKYILIITDKYTIIPNYWKIYKFANDYDEIM